MLQVFNKKGEILVADVPPPVCESGKVLVKNIASLISTGTETSGVKSASQNVATIAVKNPDLTKKVLGMVKTKGLIKTIKDVQAALKSNEMSPMGYSSAGIVVEIGEGVTHVNVGDKVACAGARIANHADYVVVPKNLVAKVPENVDLTDAATTTVGSIALEGVRRSRAELGETVVVTGLGLIGQIAVQLLNAAGCITIGIDLDKNRVNNALKAGMDYGIVVSEENPIEKVLSYTQGIGADAVIICAATKSNQPVTQAVEMIRKRGRIVMVGVAEINFPRSPFYEKEGSFLISTSYGPGRYDKQYEEKGIDYPIAYVRWTENRNMKAYLDLISKSKINLEAIISEKLPVQDAPEAYNKLINDPDKPLSIILKYPKKNDLNDKRTVPINKTDERHQKTDKVNVAVVGIGGFAQSVHLPNMEKIEACNIHTLISHDGNKVMSASKKFHAINASTDYNDTLKDELINLVVITTRHNTHAPMTIQALKAGKNVFVEKPLAMNDDELNKVIDSVNQSKNQVMVGFNRRFSPFITNIKKHISDENSPAFLHYRVNGGKAPADSWVNDPNEGGGRIIGEACHFIDLLSYLANDLPIKIYAKSIISQSTNTIDSDNIICILTYPNGSIASLNYTTEGSSMLPKEYLEVHINEKSIIMNDFKSLEYFGFKEKNVKTKSQNKGHFEEMKQTIDSLLAGKPMPITFDSIVNTTRTSFAILESLRSGKEIIL